MSALAALLATGWTIDLHGCDNRAIHAVLKTPQGSLMVEVREGSIREALEGLMDELIFAGAAQGPTKADA